MEYKQIIDCFWSRFVLLIIVMWFILFLFFLLLMNKILVHFFVWHMSSVLLIRSINVSNFLFILINKFKLNFYHLRQYQFFVTSFFFSILISAKKKSFNTSDQFKTQKNKLYCNMYAVGLTEKKQRFRIGCNNYENTLID